ncbi:FAD binding domain-containing protein [Corynespora cassiicola Philippines]|uniref:FAD binding domain-containing protein n=1 Tax=Corynespora cassiicola Philippines TaxID=1448308 RepID=A0A2T2P8H7_CORCC|nr:FAD binding domain-containing protein [Corynespora cassiicola Philippines]
MSQKSNAVQRVDTSSLQSRLSSDATITDASQPLRWSDFKAPQPGRIVHPATAEDVSTIVQWANEHNVPFLVQSGGNGWAKTFTLDETGILIQLDKLRSVVFNENGTQVTIGGGALISDVVPVAEAKSSLVLTGVCNTVGALGAILGGGFSSLGGQFGLGVDDVLSLDVVKPDGQAITISAAQDAEQNDKDLFWAMRGAGPSFGIVTSAVLRAHPVSADKLYAWTGPLIFAPSQLEDVINTIQGMEFVPQMAMALNFLNLGAPTIITTLFYHGSAENGRLAFKALLDVGPLKDATAIVPYSKWNAGSDIACSKGGRKPTFGVGLAKLDPASWRSAFDAWAELIQQPGAERSSVLLNVVPMDKARNLPDSTSSYPFRHTVNFHVTLTANYTDAAFDGRAIEYGQKVRAIWQATDGLAQHSTYVNNAFGDESLETVYGNSLRRLKAMKKQVDPHNRFNQWFSIM